MTQQLTKQGRYGNLYLYRVTYELQFEDPRIPVTHFPTVVVGTHTIRIMRSSGVTIPS